MIRLLYSGVLTVACSACLAADVESGDGDESNAVVAAASVEENLFLSKSVWSDFTCIGNEDCRLADVDGDGLDDAVSINRTAEEIWVSTSNGSSFNGGSRWIAGNACGAGDRCLFGDVDGNPDNNYVDLVVIDADDTWVSLSNGSGFAPRMSWGGGDTCTAAEDCHLGNVVGGKRKEIIAFVKDSQSGAGRGDVYVSEPLAQPGSPYIRTKWADSFCIGNEVCDVADVNGDGYDDLVSFTRSTQTGSAEGDVWVALADPANRRFGPSSIWHTFFCVGNESCQTGDVDRDGKEDLISITGTGQAWVGLSTGTGFATGELWHSSVCANGEICRVGNVGGRGGNADIVAFTRDSQPEPKRGDVTVSLSEKLPCASYPETSTCTLGAWPGGIIYYAWDSAISASDRSLYRSMMDQWQDVSAHAVEFREDPSKTAKVRILPCLDSGDGRAPGYNGCKTSGCSAYFCPWNASHELGHVLGFRHQHQRQDRDHYIRINRNRYCSNGDQVRCNQPNVSDFGPYDYKSVLHYAPTDPDIERWDQSPICESVDYLGGCWHDDSGPNGRPTAGDGAAVVELYRPQYGKFMRTMNVNDPSPYNRLQSPFDENLASGVRISSTTSPALETWGGASLAMYLRGTDNNIYKKSFDTGTQQWSTSWEALGRPSGVSAASDPGVVSWGSGRTDVVVRGGTSIYIMSTPTWGSWQSLGSPPNGAASAPAITSFGTNHLDVFVRAGDDKIYHKWCGANCSGNSGSWSSWDVLGTGTFRGKPAVVARGTNYIELFGHGMDDKLWWMRFDPGLGGWGSWNQAALNGTLRWDASCPDCNSPAAGSRHSSNVDVYVRGTDNKLWWASWSGQTWSGYEALGGVLSSSPGTVTRLRATERADIVVVMPEERSRGAALRHGTWWKQIGL